MWKKGISNEGFERLNKKAQGMEGKEISEEDKEVLSINADDPDVYSLLNEAIDTIRATLKRIPKKNQDQAVDFMLTTILESPEEFKDRLLQKSDIVQW